MKGEKERKGEKGKKMKKGKKMRKNKRDEEDPCMEEKKKKKDPIFGVPTVGSRLSKN